MKKIIFDTDIGSDIDDAICLSYLLSNPECQLMGVTTVSGEAEKRAMMVDALIKHHGKQAPVYPGTERPMLTLQRQPQCRQAEKLGPWPHEKEFKENFALQFLKETIEKNPGEISLLAVGPMTNIGLLFASYPHVAGLLKELVMMIGNFYCEVPGAPLSEWNAICDPYAAAIVYSNDAARHVSYGLDVTMKVRMSRDEVTEKFSKYPMLAPVLDFCGPWFKDRDRVTFHDPLAAVSMFHEDLCGYERGTVGVELNSERFMGFTDFRADEKGPHTVAKTVDPEKFFEYYFEYMK